jgi:hypothetical protein
MSNTSRIYTDSVISTKLKSISESYILSNLMVYASVYWRLQAQSFIKVLAVKVKLFKSIHS